MAISRRNLVHGLGAGVLGTGVLAACTPSGGVSRGRGRRKPTTAPTGDALTEPETPLVLGSIGASFGRAAPFESAISIAIHEAMIDVNSRWKGLFGHEVEMAERHVMAEAGEDLTDVVATLADSGVTAVITSIDEESLTAAIPALVEAGIAVIDVLTSGMGLRAAEVKTSNMLMRLAPNDRAIAALYEEAAWSETPDRGGKPGTVAYVSEDTEQGRSLHQELSLLLGPAGGKIVAEHFYPIGTFGDSGSVVDAVLKAPPALLVVNGGPEVGPFLSALHKGNLDEGQRPIAEFSRRLSPAASVDYVEAKLAPESLASATGYEPGGELTVDHINMMLNVDPNLLRTGYAYSQQGYDAVMMTCLAAQDALSVSGADIATSFGKILTGTEECTDYNECRELMTDALKAGTRATVAYSGRSGALELGPEKDALTGSMRTVTWSDANELEDATVESFEAPK